MSLSYSIEHREIGHGMGDYERTGIEPYRAVACFLMGLKLAHLH